MTWQGFPSHADGSGFCTFLCLNSPKSLLLSTPRSRCLLWTWPPGIFSLLKKYTSSWGARLGPPVLQAEAAGSPSPGGCVCGCPEEAAGPDATGPGRAAGALGHLLCTGREEFFARPLKELFFRLRDQVPANLGDENRGLEGGKEKDAVSAGQGPGHRGPPSAAGHALVPGVRRARLPLHRRLALGHAQCSVVQGRGQAGRW